MSVTCNVCFRHCQIPEGKTGFCKTKENVNGTIVDRGYGKLTSLALDPIEKKPLARFYPGSKILSFGSYGCCLACPFCQNWEISQVDLNSQSFQAIPKMLVEKALELVPMGCIGLAATYNEPAISPDFLHDTFKLAKENGLKTACITSGSVPIETLDRFLPYTDAFNIDLKGFTPEFYQWTGGDLETTKAFIEHAAKHAHVEITTLVIPGKNDDPDTIEEMCRWIAGISPDIPLHLSVYFPRYECDIPSTPAKTMYKLRDIAQKHLRHVYLGNMH